MPPTAVWKSPSAGGAGARRDQWEETGVERRGPPFLTHGYVNSSQILFVRDAVGHSPSVEAGLVDLPGVRKVA